VVNMMRTVEAFIVIVIILGAYGITSYYAVLPGPQKVAPMDLRRLALSTLETLDSNHDLSLAAFDINNSVRSGNLQIALAASLPSNVIYNLTVYDVNSQASNGTQLYTSLGSISNAANSGISSDSSTYMSVSSNVSFSLTPQKIGAGGVGGTLYILNCNDANGWWITGYTSQSLASDLFNMLSPYFVKTVLVNSTSQLGQILNGTSLQGETVQNAVIINTCGEAVPIPSGYYNTTGVGFDSSSNSYSRYTYTLGQRVLQYNWTWVSIAGYPLYYVSNSALFPNGQNTWGIYGMQYVGPSGLNAFLGGIDNQTYAYNSTGITADLSNSGPVTLSNIAINQSNYYGIYPNGYQTATRALPTYIINGYHFNVTTYVFNTVSNNWNAGAIYRHSSTVNGVSQFQGALFALGVTRTPDVRLTALGILSDYQPSMYGSGYSAAGTSRLVVLQLGLVGGSSI
jgi:hypothetical protein